MSKLFRICASAGSAAWWGGWWASLWGQGHGAQGGTKVGNFYLNLVKYEREIQEAGVVREKGYFDPDPIRVKPRCI